MNKILFKELEVFITYNAKLKNSYISIHSDKKITIKTPTKAKIFIVDLLVQKETWIRKQLKKLEKIKVINVNLEDELLLFGELYSIDSNEAKYLRDKITKIKVSSPEKILKCYNDFYKYVSQEYLKSRVEYFSQVMSLNYSLLKYRKMKSRWGSCSSLGVITLNSELMKIQKELIDYVVVHELAHLVHMNHSKKFHSLVDQYLPNSKLLRKELKNIRLLH